MLPIITLTSLGSVFYGLALGVLSFRAYAYQREVIKGKNTDAALRAGANQAIIGSLLLATLPVCLPVLGPFAALITPFAYFITLLPVFASLCAGGYAHLKQSWSKSKFIFVKQILDFVDEIIAELPTQVITYSNKFLIAVHPWLGAIYLGAQAAVFGIMLVTAQPLVGIAGLSYFSIAYLRANNYLPEIIAIPLEKFNYVVGVLSAVFLQHPVLKLRSMLGMAYEFVFNAVLPKALTYVLGDDSEFLQAAKLTKVRTSAPKIRRDVSVETFRHLFNTLPKNVPRNITGAHNDAKRAEFMTQELRHLLDDLLTRMHDLPAMQALRASHNVPVLPANDFLTRLRNRIFYIPGYLEPRYNVLQESLGLIRKFFTIEAAASPYSMTVKHMIKVPFFLPDPPSFNFAAFKQLVLNSGLENSLRMFKSKCFESAHFRAVDPVLESSFIDLNHERNRLIMDRIALRQGEELDQARLSEIAGRIAAIDVAIEQVQAQLIDAWKPLLELEPTATAAQVIIKYILTRLNALYGRIQTGDDMLWDKSINSFGDFQKQARHLLAHCQKYFTSENPVDAYSAHSILGNLATSSDLCATGVYGVVQTLYSENVLPELSRTHAEQFSPEDRIALYLQEERQKLFDQIYAFLMESPIINTLFGGVDLRDRYTYNFVVKALSVFNLKAQFNAQSDLSSSQTGFAVQLELNLIAYIIAQIMMILEHGYSPDNIIQRMGNTNRDGDNFMVFNAGSCCMAWAQSFTDPELREKVTEMLIASVHITGDETSSALLIKEREAERQKQAREHLIAMMLYDYEVVTCTSEQKQQAVSALIAPHHHMLVAHESAPVLIFAGPDSESTFVASGPTTTLPHALQYNMSL